MKKIIKILMTTICLMLFISHLTFAANTPVSTVSLFPKIQPTNDDCSIACQLAIQKCCGLGACSDSEWNTFETNCKASCSDTQAWKICPSANKGH